ncbi:hypothetical protein NPIL_676731 [Nephila pilipes]|uniref:Uncharacterized protein n=1 Tax=Nephila pilipes TaxID=299642 RepID=A0A8X6MR80_NEPPI|nr:hypothetical protein NPIL_676731 [Nephila pilipes]
MIDLEDIAEHNKRKKNPLTYRGVWQRKCPGISNFCHISPLPILSLFRLHFFFLSFLGPKKLCISTTIETHTLLAYNEKKGAKNQLGMWTDVNPKICNIEATCLNEKMIRQEHRGAAAQRGG